MNQIDGKENRHTRKTRTAIQNALLSLMSSKPIEKITISELSDHADINRKTFYNHYTSLQDVLLELDEMYLDMLFPSDERNASESKFTDTYLFLDNIVTELTTHPERTKLLFDSGVSAGLTQRLKESLRPYIRQMSQNLSLSPVTMTYLLDYIVYGIAAILDEWVHSENQLTKTEMSTMIYALVEISVHGFTEKFNEQKE